MSSSRGGTILLLTQRTHHAGPLRWPGRTSKEGQSMTTNKWNMVVSKVRGRFAKYAGTIHLDESDFTRSVVVVMIDAASLDTGAPDRDTHLRGPDFFDVARFPELRFRSRRIEKVADARYRVIG